MILITLSVLLCCMWLPSSAADTEPVYYKSRDAATTSTELSNIALRLYTSETIYEYKSVQVGNAVELMRDVDTSKPTVFYIFGWSESPNSTSVVTVVSAYLKRGDHNVVLIDWQYIAASQFYPIVLLSTSRVGKTVAAAIDEMIEAGLNSTSIHIVGHSLGSPIAGFIGRNMKHTLPRITGLDPAGPGFYLLIRGLSSSDAKFVDVIHTDAGVYGTATNVGTANFFPNGGTRVQPGCPIIFVPYSTEAFCSHYRSWHFYSESLLIEDAFIGVSCASYTEFIFDSCSDATVAMGYATPTTTRGNFYLQTKNASPYGKGAKGKTYVTDIQDRSETPTTCVT